MATDRENGLLQTAYSAGITDPTELANLMAQVGHESSGLNRLEEGFRYTQGASQISANVRSALREGSETLESARLEALNGKPEHLAELMYGGRMGNNEPGDGYLYRGRGYIQLTGKNQYREAGEALDLDLVRHPELAAEPDNAARIATWYWRKNVPQGARDDAREAGAAINGRDPPNGLADRENRFDRWQRTITPELIQMLSSNRLNQPAPSSQESAGPAVASSFQRTMETMLPSQGRVDAHVTGQYGEPRQGHRPHGGTDFNYEGGQTGINRRHPIVHSPVAGTVTFSGGQYGTVKIRDAQGHSHEVLHLDSCSVTAGQVIAAGDPIGRMGGRGPGGASDYDQHVHYQLRDPQGRLISPQTFWDQGRQQPADGQRHVGGGQDALRHGDHGPQVLALQHALNRQGIGDRHGHRLAEDGRFGDNTRDAVKAFQQRHGLEVDGVVGKDTRGALAGQHQDQTFGARPSGQGLGPNDPHHPDSALHAALKRQLPGGTSEEAAAHVTAQAKLHGIDSPEKLQGVLVRDGKAFVMGNTPGFRATIDLSQAPSVEQSNQLLLASQAGALAQEQAPAVAVGPR